MKFLKLIPILFIFFGNVPYKNEVHAEVKNPEDFRVLSNENKKLSISNVEYYIKQGDIFIKDGVSVAGAVEITEVITQEIELFQNVPNPVMDITSISFYLPEDANVRLTVSNTLGQEIMTLSDSSFSKGMHSVNMDATSLTTGVYFYKLEANKRSLTKQLTLVK